MNFDIDLWLTNSGHNYDQYSLGMVYGIVFVTLVVTPWGYNGTFTMYYGHQTGILPTFNFSTVALWPWITKA